ncbi:S49 family peptidase [Thioalkalicoccus limnaeus]|uniref:S49 family peptidase n=1 Tax=Thioalkalicoccus limnaeus TaxID=120681 RepID=A0ABV4BD47_9GAMM
MNWRFWRRAGRDLPQPGAPNWEQAMIGHMANEYLRERRRRRRWSSFFKGLFLVYLFAVLISFYAEDLVDRVRDGEGHTALIEVKGIIAPDTRASADRVVGALRAAFEDERTRGVVLRINSPGGSPVQAGYINDEIRRLKAQYLEDHDRAMPVYAVAADLCASGAYYIAVAADEIYADKASLIGSIGVRIDGFGLEELIDKLGIERRLMTAGQNKGILDPFSPMTDKQRDFLQGVLDELHQQFIAAVKAGRGDRLNGDEAIFSGLFWSGEQSVEMGLVDGLGSASYVARELIGAEKFVDFTKKGDLWERLSERLATEIAGAWLRMTTADSLPSWR